MPRICHRHHISVPIQGECPDCVAELENPRLVADMTPAERLAEFETWADEDATLEVEIDRLMPRLNALVGRSIFTHEIGFNIDGLRAEIRGEKAHPEFLDEITACIPKDKQVVIIDLSPPSTAASEN